MALPARQYAVTPQAAPGAAPESAVHANRSSHTARQHGNRSHGEVERSSRPVRRRVEPGQRVVATRRHGGLEAGAQQLVRATVGIRASDRHLSLVAPRGRRAAHVAVVMSVLLGLAMLGAAAFQTRLAQSQVQLDQLDTDISGARELYETLRRERAELRSPERLAGIAAANGIQPTNDSDFIDITPEVRAIVAASTGDIDPAHLGDADNTLDDFRDVKAATADATATP